jgi:gliding motility-associated-like protein
MVQIKFLLFCSLLVLFSWVTASAQESNCENLDFDLGNFTDWVGYTWIYSTETPTINTSKVKGIVKRRQTIISDTTAYDANTGNALKEVPSGYNYSARLGDEIVSSDANPRCWEQSLRYTMTIDSSNALLIMKFACVLEYASDHTAKMEPRFRLTLYDENGDSISDCSNYDVYSTSNNAKGFQSYTPSGSNNPVKWRDWTTVGANLLKYIGQSITVEFMSADCTGKYHFGYAYFIAECQSMIITVKYCSGDSTASLIAPEGFETYTWTDSTGTVVDTSRTFYVANPTEGATYTCTLVSATGCTVSLQSTIAKYTPVADFSSYMIDCNSNTVQFTNLSTLSHGTLSYKWDFGDGGTSTSKNPAYTFSTSGLHEVTLVLSNPPSSCVDTITKEVESFSPPLVGIEGDSTYCPDESVYLKAYGAYYYKWSTGSTSDSIEVSAPGGKFWLIGSSTTGCTSDTIYETVTEEPDWTFSAEGDTTFCDGQSSVLTTSGAVDYLWNTGDTINSITVSATGTYTCTGANKRGCQKTNSFNVLVYPLPGVDFTLSSNTLSTKHNEITGCITAQTGVQYLWNMDDGSTETGSTIEHTYNISNAILEYTILLIATTQYDCVDSASKTVDVVPFVPNVFSPNGDGINDLFMPDLELQVFDRYGTILYKGSTGWDGKYNGRMVGPDTYFYLIYYTDSKEKIHARKGYITLVR